METFDPRGDGPVARGRRASFRSDDFEEQEIKQTYAQQMYAIIFGKNENSEARNNISSIENVDYNRSINRGARNNISSIENKKPIMTDKYLNISSNIDNIVMSKEMNEDFKKTIFLKNVFIQLSKFGPESVVKYERDHQHLTFAADMIYKEGSIFDPESSRTNERKSKQFLEDKLPQNVLNQVQDIVNFNMDEYNEFRMKDKEDIIIKGSSYEKYNEYVITQLVFKKLKNTQDFYYISDDLDELRTILYKEINGDIDKNEVRDYFRSIPEDIRKKVGMITEYNVNRYKAGRKDGIIINNIDQIEVDTNVIRESDFIDGEERETADALKNEEYDPTGGRPPSENQSGFKQIPNNEVNKINDILKDLNTICGKLDKLQ